jgi:prepilin-type N-terminal cleavage/methylation domain-containing protein
VRFASPGNGGSANAPTSDRSEAGFTLIELLIVIGVMPMVVGACVVGLLSILSLQSSVSNRLTDSGDAQIVAVNFQNDVQGATQITTANSSQTPTLSPAPCGTGFQVLGLQLGNGSEISYAAAAASSGNTYNLWRYVCPQGSSTPPSSSVLAHDVPASMTQPTAQGATPPLTITCSSSTTACAPTGSPAYQSAWVPAVGVTGVTFNTTAPGSAYTYQLVAVPAAASNSTNLAQVFTPSTGCGFATPGTGTYASTLCFVDFAPWNTQTSAANISCQAPAAGFSTPVAMSAGIAKTPYTLSFCVSVSSQWNAGSGNSGAITGPTTQSPRVGVDDITAVPLPTYASPPTSEAFLGNNGFYTGVPGDPALYTVDSNSTATINITNIAVLTANKLPVSNWELVTGDAESTDTSESITWSSDQKLSLLDNTPNSPVGNACMSTPPSTNASYLTGLGTPTVQCSSTVSADHTGTVMLQATTPTQLTVTLNGTGLQAMFLGVLLS